MINATTSTHQLPVVNKNPMATGNETAIAVRADNCFGLKFFGFNTGNSSGKLQDSDSFLLDYKSNLYPTPFTVVMQSTPIF